MELIKNFVPTSKAQLLQVAMYFNGNNIEKAQQMFDFYAKNLDLPDFDPVAPSFLQQVKSNASGLFSWVKENQEDIMQGYQFIQSVIKNKGALPVTPPADAPLPSIND